MATIRQFEDLVCWQRARQLVKFIYSLTCQPTFSRDHGLVDQIQRAAVSVMSNIAEGFDRGTKDSLINYCYIAKGSCGEVRCQLYVAGDLGYITPHQLEEGLRLTDESARLLASFIEKVKGGAGIGMQYKAVVQDDGRKELLRQNNPDLFKKFYPNG